MRLQLPGRRSKTLGIMTSHEVKVAQCAGYGQIYFVGFEGDGPEDPIKVGYTWSIVTRLNGLQNSNWRKIKVHDVLHVEATYSMVEVNAAERNRYNQKVVSYNEAGTHPKEAEGIVHAALRSAGLHHSREWFSGGPQRVIQIATDALKSANVSFMTTQSMRRYAIQVQKEAGYR